MTALLLQQSLMKEVEEITKDMLFQNPLRKTVPLKAYAQELPIQSSEYEEEQEEYESEDPFPYCIVKVMDGKIENSSQIIRTLLLIGLFEEDSTMQGHRRILNIFQRIQERFLKNPVLDKKYVLKDGIEWALQEENIYPYFYGGMELNWETASIRRENLYG